MLQLLNVKLDCINFSSHCAVFFRVLFYSLKLKSCLLLVSYVTIFSFHARILTMISFYFSHEIKFSSKCLLQI